MNIKTILVVGLLLISIIPYGATETDYNDCPFNIINYITEDAWIQHFTTDNYVPHILNVSIIMYAKTKVRYEYLHNDSAGCEITSTQLECTGMEYTDEYSTFDSTCFSMNMPEGTVLYGYSSAYAHIKDVSPHWSFYSARLKAVGTHVHAHIDTEEIIEGNVLFYTSNQTIYNVSGNTACLDSITLYEKDNNNVVGFKFFNSTNTNYTFFLLNGTYEFNFSDGHEYEFEIDGANITYDYDACAQTTYEFKESCYNLIPDSEGFYCEWTAFSRWCFDFEEPDGILNISNSSANRNDVYVNTFAGQRKWIIDPVVNNMTYTLLNPFISWGLKVIVQNESGGSLIDDGMVKVDQGCYCTDDYSIRQKLIINGMATFEDMSLQDASLYVIVPGYKTLDISSTNYSESLSGLSNFSSKTWIIKLAQSESDNESAWYESQNKVDIHFRNEDGNRTSKILNTDTDVYLYYENNNTNEEDMTLKFQSSSTHTYFIDEQSWNIPCGEIGHKTIANVDFTPYDYSYRAVIYNSSIYGWNITIPLTVRNDTKESDQHYKNLTTDLWFVYANAGRIDYRNDMDIGIHAGSNNTTLMTVDVELWEDGIYTDHTNLTWADFTTSDPQFYYIWSPAYNYESGSNYSIRMYGFDRTLLETDYVECYTDDVIRKNKLTILVKNQDDIPLDNAFVYLEDWGSLPTGSNNYNAYEGLDNGYYRFKATKPDYVGTGWSDITLSDSDEIVTYVLTWSGSEEGSAMQEQKMSDSDLSNIYLMLMAIVLIFVILGGFVYAIK